MALAADIDVASRPRGRWPRAAPAALLIALLAAPLLAALAAPRVGDCVVLSVTGVPCPGCGLGRAVVALFNQTDPLAALLAYPPLAALACGYLTVLAAVALRLRGSEPRIRAATPIAARPPVGLGSRGRGPGHPSAWGQWTTTCGIVTVFALLANWVAQLALLTHG